MGTTGVYRHSGAIGSTPKPAAACYEVQIATLDSPIDPVTSEQKAIAEPSSQPRRRPALPVPSDEVDRGRLGAELAQPRRVLAAVPLAMHRHLRQRLADRNRQRLLLESKPPGDLDRVSSRGGGAGGR